MAARATGERVVPEDYLRSRDAYLIYAMHLATYDHAAPWVEGKDVLDFGCGTGYGAARLAARGASIRGVDVSEEAIAHARATYARPGLSFERIARIEERPLPFADASFDVVLSFQVIEHVPDADAYLREVRRVLRPGGRFILATPDRRTRLFPFQRPWNRFHLVEYSAPELARLLATRFDGVEILTMSADEAILGSELRRTHRLRCATLPLTLPWTPEPLRVGGLAVLKALQDRLRSSGGEAPRSFGFDESAIRIGPDLSPSVNLVGHAVVAR